MNLFSSPSFSIRLNILPSPLLILNSWDNTLHLLHDHSNAVLRDSISIELCKVFNGGLPIIIEGHIQILENEQTFFNCIIHTKAFLKFSLNEKPINDLVKMLDECNEQEEMTFGEAILGHKMDRSTFPKTNYYPEVRFNKAYELKEYAIKVGLLNAQ